jgi:hypothetical protein
LSGVIEIKVELLVIRVKGLILNYIVVAVEVLLVKFLEMMLVSVVGANQEDVSHNVLKVAIQLAQLAGGETHNIKCPILPLLVLSAHVERLMSVLVDMGQLGVIDVVRFDIMLEIVLHYLLNLLPTK